MALASMCWTAGPSTLDRWLARALTATTDTRSHRGLIPAQLKSLSRANSSSAPRAPRGGRLPCSREVGGGFGAGEVEAADRGAQGFGRKRVMVAGA